jgi:hypothetical protein
VYENEYDLILRPDINTHGHTQWCATVARRACAAHRRAHRAAKRTRARATRFQLWRMEVRLFRFYFRLSNMRRGTKYKVRTHATRAPLAPSGMHRRALLCSSTSLT